MPMTKYGEIYPEIEPHPFGDLDLILVRGSLRCNHTFLAGCVSPSAEMVATQAISSEVGKFFVCFERKSTK